MRPVGVGSGPKESNAYPPLTHDRIPTWNRVRLPLAAYIAWSIKLTQVIDENRLFSPANPHRA
jgi:hypothetical protein